MIIESLTKEELILTVENQSEAALAVNVFTNLRADNLEDMDEYRERLLLNNPTYIVPAGRSALEGNGGWIQNTVTTDYLEPYWNLLKQWTNCNPFSIDLTDALKPILHTCINLSLVTDGEGYAHYTSIFRVYAYMGQWLTDDVSDVPPNKKPGRLSLVQKAEYDALRHINDQLGETLVEKEYIPTGWGGNSKPNPNYAKGDNKIVKSARNEKVWRLIWEYWETHYSTDTQRELLSRVSTLKDSDLKAPSLSSIYCIHYDNWKSSITPEEFANLE